MKIKVNRVELKEALERVRPGLASKDIIDQATSFAFLKDRVVTYNDEISISHPVKGLGLTGAVKAEALYAFLSRVKDEVVEFNVDDNQLNIRAGRSRAGLVIESEIRLPLDEIEGEKDWKPLPKSFLNGVKSCYPCCSTDMSMPALTCVYVNRDRMYGTNSFHLMRYELEEEVPVDPFLLPSSAAKELIKYDVTSISMGYGWVHFSTDDGTVFSARTMSGEYPDAERLFESVDGVEVEFPAGVIDVLERAEVFAQTTGIDTYLFPVVKFSFSGRSLKIRSANKTGWFEEDIECCHDGEDVSATCSVDYLKDALRYATTCVIGGNKLRFADSHRQYLIATVEGGE